MLPLPDNYEMRLILASASPRRKELLTLFGLPFTIQVAHVDEESITHPDPATNVVGTARLKAEAVAQRVDEPAIIIASDTTVAIDGEMLNKPASAAEAREMLTRLRGRQHQVHTSLYLINTGSGRRVADVASVDVPMRTYSDAEIAAYVASGDPMDKAGAYAIQNLDFNPVSELAGCYAAVMGLPLCHLARCLRQLGVTGNPALAAACQQHHDYHCPVYAGILQGEPDPP